jgi:hypothetical protein
MAAPHLDHARSYLVEHGVLSAADGRYDEHALEAALRSQGWTLTWDGQAGDWVVEIGEELAPAQFQYAVAGGPDRADALLHALAIALTWQTDADEWQVFDAQTQDLIARSGEAEISVSARRAPALVGGHAIDE